MKLKHCIPKSLATGLVALLLMALSPGRASAMQYLNGTVYLSQITDKEIVISGSATIIVDCSKKVKYIDHPGSSWSGTTLDIIFQSPDYTFTVEQSERAPALSVETLNVLGPGKLIVTSRTQALCCNTANFTNVYVKGKGRNDSSGLIHNMESHSTGIFVTTLNINNSEVYATGRRTGIELYGKMTITGENSKVTAEGRGNDSSGSDGSGFVDFQGQGIGYGNFDGEVPSKGIIEVQGGELNVQSDIRCGIYCKELRISGGKVTVNSDLKKDYQPDLGAIICRSINMTGGILNVSSNLDGICIWGGSSSYLNGGIITAIGGKYSDGICVYTGDLYISGENTQVNANGSNGGIQCNNKLYIDRADVFAKARADGYRAVQAQEIHITLGDNVINALTSNMEPFYANHGIYMYRPFVLNGVNQPQYATSSAGVNIGQYLTLNGTNIKKKATLTKPNINSWGYYFSGLSKVGNNMVLTIPQEITNYVNCIDAVKTIDWYRSDDETTIGDYLASGETYTVRTADLGKYIYAKLSYDTHTGSLRSNAVRVNKTPNTSTPVKPTLAYSTSSDKIAVTNAKSNQEYLVLTSEVNDNDITEAQWANAEQGTSSTYLLLNGGNKGKLNYVYTRFKETASQDPGQVILHTSIYYGSASGMTDFTLTATTTSGSALQQDANGAYNVAYNSVVKLTVAPVPSSVSWQGVTGENWLINMDTSGGTMYGSDMGYLYTDAACTTPIVVDGEHYYKTVYYKFVNNSHNGLTGMVIDAIATVGSNTVDHWLTFNVSNSSGTWNVMNIAPSLFQVERGSVITLPYTTNPGAATCNTLTAEAVANTWGGIAPTLTFNPSAKTVTIDATNSVANSNYYRYDLYADGKKLSLRKGVEVLPATVKGVVLNPHQVVLDPGTTLQLSATVLPSCAADDATVTWRVTNSNYATISNSGLVTITSTPNCLGETVLAIATSGDYSDTCRIQITGEKYSLWINGTRVNSMNQDDVLGDGKVSYEAGKLSLNGVNLQSATNDSYILQSYDPLIINIKGTNTLSNGTECVGLIGSTRLTGNGVLKVMSTGQNYTLNAYADLSIEDSVKVETSNYSNDSWGIRTFGDLSVEGPMAQLRAYGTKCSAGFGSLNGTITEPQGGNPVYVEQWNTCVVADAAGNIVNNAWVTFNGEEESGLKGDVNGDGRVNVSDVSTLINMILGITPMDQTAGDVNGDGRVNVSDVSALINIILGIS